MSADTKKELDRIKSSVFARTLSLAKLSLRASATAATQGITQALKSDDEKEALWKSVVEKQASNITSELGQLKGSLLKAGQMLSMYGEHFLPPEANKLLRSLQADTPPLKWEAIEPVIKANLSAELMDELEIEKKALACASLGQVHRARIKATGENVVLKIQYPEVDKAINSDLKALRTLLSALKLLPADLNLDPVFAEIQRMLVQETDYRIEAEFTEKYRKLLGDDPRFVIPKIYFKYSNNKLLVTSYERGFRADEPIVQNLSQERRNQLASNFLDLYFTELFKWGLIQTDPHTGNYKIRLNSDGQDQIVLLDFGATKQFEESFLQPYRAMLTGALHNNKDQFYKAAYDLKFIYESDPAELKELFEKFCMQTVEPFIDFKDARNFGGQISEDGSYDWKNTDLPERLSKLVVEIAKKFAWRTPPQEILFLDRKTGGVFIFLSVLKARFRSRDNMLSASST